MTYSLLGTSILGGERGSAKGESFKPVDPKTGIEIEPLFFSASESEVEGAIGAAARDFNTYSRSGRESRSRFLRTIADKIEGSRESLIERCPQETGYPVARIETEIARTCYQLRLFAELVEQCSWVDARIDHADPERKPIPKPDIRSMLRPVGPVAVFCASNFPLAFSVAGGDTASALAVGSPVVVIANSAHPGTAEIVGAAIGEAVRECEIPEGVFSLLFAKGYDVGQSVVLHPDIKAVGFTGSRSGGFELMKIASERREPIPVFAEMSSVNPIFILPGYLAKRSEEMAAGLFNSFTLGLGQFCTKPGLVFSEASDAAAGFTEKLNSLAAEYAPAPLLTDRIKSNYLKGVSSRAAELNIMAPETVGDGFAVMASVFQTTVSDLLARRELSEEIFGPTTLLITADGKQELIDAAKQLEGQLTAAIFGTPKELEEYRDLIEILEKKAGRLIFNAFPTGVEVCHAMVHGGPFPATSDARTTSVGTRSIERFCRPVCFQGFPDAYLPEELKESNPLSIWRLVDGEFTQS